MNRGLAILLAALLLAIAAAAGIYSMRQPKSPLDWMRQHYGLTQGQTDRVAAIEQSYGSRCAAMCARISDANARLSALVQANRGMTPEIQAAIATADQVRTDCRTSMLAHFYEVAAVLPENRRAEYLSMMLPAVIHPEEMGGQRVAP